MVSETEPPVNTARPVSISYRTHPLVWFAGLVGECVRSGVEAAPAVFARPLTATACFSVVSIAR
jgi:hypothetical protein